MYVLYYVDKYAIMSTDMLELFLQNKEEVTVNLHDYQKVEHLNVYNCRKFLKTGHDKITLLGLHDLETDKLEDNDGPINLERFVNMFTSLTH